MHIPAPAQDLHLPLTQRQEANPVLPVTAVPGVAEQAQSLDSRVALQWTQPVFQGDQGQAARSALAAPLPLPVPGFEPQGADPDALSSGQLHPLLAQGLATWLGRVLGKPNAQTPPTGPAWPKAPLLADASTTAAPTEPSVQARLSGLYRALAGSDVFAAQRLAEAWVPVLAPTRRQAVLSSHGQEDAQQPLATPAEPSSAPQWAQWVAALEPDSDAAQQAARMLTQGQMLWQTELAPGVPLRMVREDAWRNHPMHPGQLEKGATLRVEVDLPRLGRLRVVGSQWGSDLSLHIAHASDAQGDWAALTPELLQDLQARGVREVRVESLSEEPARG
jgi:hypothetical protein